jgi:hypothetical protein
MADPVTYTFYGTTIPVLRNICTLSCTINLSKEILTID